MITFQEMLRRLALFWEQNNCIIHQGYDLEVGAGTMNPATFLRCLGPEPYRAAYIEPSRRPTDGRYGENPNRLQHYFQYQVILKPSPLNMQQLYLESLAALGIDLAKHDIRFVHDDWENPTIGAWGLGWEVWMDGMEITQYTYFQSVGGIPVNPVTGELTYGLERLAMYLQNVDSVYDLQWNEYLTYGDIYHRNEVEWSHYNFEEASTKMWLQSFEAYEEEAKRLIERKLPIPAYEFVMKASHAFNILDARGTISVTERTGYIGRIRDLARLIAQGYIESREAMGFPLSQRFPVFQNESPNVPPVPETLLAAGPREKRDYLLEIGSEELPATFVPIGLRNLKSDLAKLLHKEGIPFDEIVMYGTPRRLTALVKGLALGTEEKVEEKRGPAASKAFDSQGNASPAGQGFFRSLGKEPLTLHQVREGKDDSVFLMELKGEEYLFAALRQPGKSTAKVLSEKLPHLILELDFPKKMRWADLEIAFARPLRWIVSLLGAEVLPFAIANVVAGNRSSGHAQLNPGSFTVPSADAYLETLRGHFVMADPEERTATINRQLDALEKEIEGAIIEREAVLPQVLNLCEWPQATAATFEANYLQAPKEVLVSEMVEHQKYFPVANADGSLKNLFIITADTNPTEQIRHGNRKVLSSRLSDGVFLYEKGLHTSFEELNEKLRHVTFIRGLGSLYDKVERLIGHSKALQRSMQISSCEKAVRAAELSKADLVSEMVFEFPELQGVIGRYYALAKNEDPEVALSLEEQWMPLGENAPLPQSETGTLLSLADKLDNLISCFSAGLKPTSSSDPHALRRQALGIIKILINGGYSLPFRKILKECCSHFDPSKLSNVEETIGEIEQFFINRIKTVFQDYGFAKDEIEASVAEGFTDIYDTFCKVKALHRFRQADDSFPKLYEVYKRAKGQLTDQKAYPFSRDLLCEDAEISLDSKLTETQAKFNAALDQQNYDQAYQLIAQIQPPLARLFDEVHILDKDPGLKANRIALLQRVFALFAKLLDFGKIAEK